MASIIYDQFGGIIPKLDPRNLPATAAQTAHNVELSGGKLCPVDMTSGFQLLHDPDTGEMNSNLPAGDIISINEPVKPVVAERIKLFRPMNWTSSAFTVGMWVTYYDAAGAFQTDIVSPSWVVGSYNWEYTEDGIVWRGYMNSKSFTAEAGIYYKVHGLKFALSFQADTKYYGGPEDAHAFPDGVLSRSSPEWPIFSMPLTAPIDYSGYSDGSEVYSGERYTYGHLQLVDVNAPSALPDVDMTDKTSNTTVTLNEAGAVEFYFRANYARNTQRFVHYVTTAVDQRVASGSSTAAYSLAVTQIDINDLLYGADDLPATGTLRLTNAAAETEDIAYSAYALVADVYEFTVSATLTYAYAIDDVVMVIDQATVGKEGPASDMSDQAVVDPGELLKLTIPRPSGIYKQNIYRGGTSANFRLLGSEGLSKGERILEDNNGIYYYYLSSATGLAAGQEYTSFAIKCSNTFSAILDSIPDTGFVRVTNTGGGDSQEFNYLSRSAVTDAGGGWVTVTVYFSAEVADHNFAAGADYIDLWGVSSSQTYIDTFIESLGVALPPYGNYPHATLAEATQGSLFLGGHTGMIFDGDEVRPSEPYKPWVYPEEYSFPLQSPILGGVAFGSTAIIFTDTHPVTGEGGKVVRVSGQNPGNLSRHVLSSCKPLLNVRSLCVIDQTGFYVSEDGLIAVSEGGVQNITEQFFNREQWETYTPAMFSAYTRDNSIFLFNLRASSPVHFRIDLNDKHAMLTTFSGFSFGTMGYKGRKEVYVRPIAFRAIQVHADDYPVSVTLIGDGGTVSKTVSIPDDNAKQLPRLRRSKVWEVDISSAFQVDRVAVATSNQELAR